MATLLVRAFLDSPVALVGPLHLDGILASAAPGISGRRLTRTCPAEAVVSPPIPVPAVTWAGHRVHLCSAAEAAADARRSSEHLTRRRDGDDLDFLAKPVDTRTGPGRDVKLRFPVTITAYLDWLCVGKRQPVLKMLRSRVQAVGSFRRHGYGVVRRWEVERVDAPALEALVFRGRARRNLPARWLVEPETVESVPVRAPYWHPSTLEPGVLAGRLTGLDEAVVERVARLC